MEFQCHLYICGTDQHCKFTVTFITHDFFYRTKFKMRALVVFVLVVVLVIANVMGDELMADDLKKYQQMTNKLMDEMDVDKPLSMQTLFL